MGIFGMNTPSATSVIEALDAAVSALDTPIKGDESTLRGDGATRYYKSGIEGVHISVFAEIEIKGSEVSYQVYGETKATAEEAAAVIDAEVNARLAEIHAATAP
jgi:hypothetical protein